MANVTSIESKYERSYIGFGINYSEIEFTEESSGKLFVSPRKIEIMRCEVTCML